VPAIVITLLVLDLRPPDARGALLHGLLAQWPGYLAYVASFGYAGMIWINHHQLFTRIAFATPDYCGATSPCVWGSITSA
jgi:uncharacterized membrane protein